MQVFGTFLEGENIYECELPKEGLIIMGNESDGISPKFQPKCPGVLQSPLCQRRRRRISQCGFSRSCHTFRIPSQMIIYQVPRLWGKGKFSDWQAPSFKHLRSLCVDAVWYTGVIRHSTGKPYVKGNIGSPTLLWIITM